MYFVSVVLATLLLVGSSFFYVRDTWRKKVLPVPATWILMFVVLSMSLWMYWHSDRRSWTGNISVTVGAINVGVVLAGVIATNIRDGTLRAAFDPVQRACLWSGVGIFFLWLATGQDLIAYILVQVMALVAYGATLRRLWRLTKSTEPIYLWLSVLVASLCAIYPTWVRNDIYSWIYLTRAVPSTAGVVYLIHRIHRRNSLGRNSGESNE